MPILKTYSIPLGGKMEFVYIIFSSNATGEPFYNDVRLSQQLLCVPSFDCLYSLLGQKNMYLYKGYEYKVVVNWAGFCPTLTVYLGHTNTPHPLYSIYRAYKHPTPTVFLNTAYGSSGWHFHYGFPSFLRQNSAQLMTTGKYLPFYNGTYILGGSLP